MNLHPHAVVPRLLHIKETPPSDFYQERIGHSLGYCREGRDLLMESCQDLSLLALYFPSPNRAISDYRKSGSERQDSGPPKLPYLPYVLIGLAMVLLALFSGKAEANTALKEIAASKSAGKLLSCLEDPSRSQAELFLCWSRFREKERLSLTSQDKARMKIQATKVLFSTGDSQRPLRIAAISALRALGLLDSDTRNAVLATSVPTSNPLFSEWQSHERILANIQEGS